MPCIKVEGRISVRKLQNVHWTLVIKRQILDKDFNLWYYYVQTMQSKVSYISKF